MNGGFISKYSFRKFQPLSLRLWHWLNAVTILGLLVTVLLRKTLLSWRSNSTLIQEKLNEAGMVITPELAKEVAVAIRNPLWDWHIFLGFTLGILLIGRIMISIFTDRKCIDAQNIKNVIRVTSLPVSEKREAIHYTFVKIGYAVFYLVTALMVVTGFMLNFKVDLNLSKDFAGVLKEIHELMMWFFVVFVGGHVIGVIIAENRNDQGLISDMINGGKLKNK